MKYLHFNDRSDIDALYSELRFNIIRVNNMFCPKKIDEECQCPDLFELLNDAAVDIGAVLRIAVLLEGASEAYEDAPDSLHREALEKLSAELEAEMASLP